jgi:hypothetical protein
VRVLQVAAAGEVVDDRHPLRRGRRGRRRRRAPRRVVVAVALARRLDPDLVPAGARACAGAGACAPPPRPPLHLRRVRGSCCSGQRRPEQRPCGRIKSVRARQLLGVARSGRSALKGSSSSSCGGVVASAAASSSELG